MVPDNSTGIPRVPAYSGASLGHNHDFAYGTFTPCGPVFHPVRLSRHVSLCLVLLPRRVRKPCGLGSSPFDRLYWGNRCYFLLLRVLRCFSSLRSLRATGTVTGSLPPGCPIRISAAVAGICPLPRLFAAYHVLLRLREPRHPPCALVNSVLSSEVLINKLKASS